MRSLLTIAASSLLILTSCTSAETVENVETQALPYESCEELNMDFLGGISKSGASNEGSLPLAEWTVDDSLYDKVSFLDDDGDGIACELLVFTQSLKNKWSEDSKDSDLDEEQVPTSSSSQISIIDSLPRSGEACSDEGNFTLGTVGQNRQTWLICNDLGVWTEFEEADFDVW